MDDSDIAYIVANKKYKLGSADYMAYVILLFPIALIIIDCAAFCYSANDPADSFPFSKSLMCAIGIIYFILCPVFFYIFIIRLRENVTFATMQTPFAKAENYKIAVDILHQSKRSVKQFPEYIVCNREYSMFRYAEEIVVIPMDKEILINSRPRSSSQQIITLIKTKSINRFEQQLNERIANGNTRLDT
jgi:hypothetical protein